MYGYGRCGGCMMVKVVRDDHEVEESVRIRFTLQESAAEPWYCNGSTRLPLFGFIRTDTLSNELSLEKAQENSSWDATMA